MATDAATISVPKTSISYESQKLCEVLLPRDAAVRGDAAVDPPSYVPVVETPRTHRLRDELDKVSMSASVLYIVGLAAIIALGWCSCNSKVRERSRERLSGA
jgi:hypothetical protein